MNRYIVEFKNDVSDIEKLNIIQHINASHVGNIFENFELIECNVDVIETLKNNINVNSVELDGYCKPCDMEGFINFPNGIINTVSNAHNHGYKGDGVIVAVIDSGIYNNHEDLQIDIFKCARVLNDRVISVDVISDINDIGGHGTMVAGVLGMQDNNIGYLGVAPNVKMMIIKGTDDSDNTLSYSSIVTSIKWAVDNGADIINISYSMPAPTTTVAAICEYAYDNGVLVVAAAGNYGNILSYSGNITATQNVSYWKDYKGVIVVGAVKARENMNEKLLPEFPATFDKYACRSIYYNPAYSRYRLFLSDKPVTIEGTSNNSFSTKTPSYNEVYDYYPNKRSYSWETVKAHTNTDYIIDWTGTGSLSQTYPHFIYTNYDIKDNVNGGIIHTPVSEKNSFANHLLTNFNQLLDNYDSSNLGNIVKAPFSSLGEGIDFVAPGYHNTPLVPGTLYTQGMGGTSFSTPYIAGMIAILKQRFPHLDNNDIYKLLKDNAVTVGDGNINHYGNGLVTMPNLEKLDFLNKIYYKKTEYKLENFIYIK